MENRFPPPSIKKGCLCSQLKCSFSQEYAHTETHMCCLCIGVCIHAAQSDRKRRTKRPYSIKSVLKINEEPNVHVDMYCERS